MHRAQARFHSRILPRLPRPHWSTLALIAGFLILLPLGHAADGRLFRAGTHVVDITPKVYPVLVNAMFTERTATNTVDPLEVRALALDDGRTRLVFAVVDTCMIARDLIDRAKVQASEATGIPTARMLVSATHTHSAPSAMGCLGSRMDTNYARFIEPLIAEAIIGAVRRLEPARVGWGSMDDWDHTFNRRYIRRPDRMITDPFGVKNVRAHMHPGHESPDAVGPSGPVDPELSVLAFQRPDGAPLALFANYSQHYYGSPLLSSDYYGRFRSYVATLLGAGAGTFVGIMSQGTSGDQMWMDYSKPAKDIGYDAYARAIATNVAGVVRGMRFREWVPLAMAERTLEFGYRVPDADRLAWARQLAKTFEGRIPRTLPEVYALESIYLHERPRTELKLQAVRIGELGIAALPNEVYAITGLKLKAQSPLRTTFNVELANGAEGYIPPPEQHKLGGYTTWAARTAGLEVGAEPRIVETLLQLLEEVSGEKRRPLEDASAPYAKAVLRSKPMAYWRLNEMVAPVARDATGGGWDATMEDGVAVYLPGASATVGIQPPVKEVPNAFAGSKINRAIHLAGGRLVADLPKLGENYSVEFWFWNGLPPDARGVTGVLFGRGDVQLSIGGTNGAPGRLVLTTGRGEATRTVEGRSLLAIRTWHHVVLTQDSGRVRVNLDGQGTVELEGHLSEGENAARLYFGGSMLNSWNFEGKLDEVAVYGRSLRPSEIARHAAKAVLRGTSR